MAEKSSKIDVESLAPHPGSQSFVFVWYQQLLAKYSLHINGNILYSMRWNHADKVTTTDSGHRSKIWNDRLL